MLVIFHGFSILIDVDQTIRQRMIDFEVYCLHYYVVAKVNNDDDNKQTHGNMDLIFKTKRRRQSFHTS